MGIGLLVLAGTGSEEDPPETRSSPSPSAIAPSAIAAFVPLTDPPFAVERVRLPEPPPPERSPPEQSPPEQPQPAWPVTASPAPEPVPRPGGAETGNLRVPPHDRLGGATFERAADVTTTPDTGSRAKTAAKSAPEGVTRPSAPVERAAVPTAASDARSAGTGGVDPGADLLVRIETGDGPSLELGWPASADERLRIADHLARCAGLTVALLARDRLWRLGDPPGRAWVPGPDRLSRILRRADGVGLGAIERIRVHHGLAGGVPVALVSRAFDARLLNGLARVAPGGRLTGHVRARYGLRGADLILSALEVDRRSVPGAVRLARIGQCG